MENERKQDFWIVAIGSSAGGEKAIEEFFAHLPCDVNAAFLVLQHPSTDFNGSIKFGN